MVHAIDFVRIKSISGCDEYGYRGIEGLECSDRLCIDILRALVCEGE